MSEPKIIEEEAIELDGKTIVVSTFDNGDVIMVELEES